MTSAPVKLAPRSRIKELRHVRASELVENPKNWRRHPQFQVDALRGALDHIGYADALIAREVDGKLMMLDGHLRAATTPDALVPVLIVDLDEAEADFLLATLDPIGALARTEGDLLKQLTDSIEFENAALARMFSASLKDAGVSFADDTQPSTPLFTDDEIIESALKYFRERGFPYRHVSVHRGMYELNQLAALSGDELLHSRLGYQLADTYHPHRFAAHAIKMRSPLDSFNDDKQLRRAMRLMLEYGNAIPDGYFDVLALVAGTQAAANFRPGFAAALYKTFCKEDAVVLDTSTGYGGRMLGFAVACRKGKYIGIDPNSLTHESNLALACDFDFDDRVELINEPAEDVARNLEYGRLDLVSLLKERCDFAFTSPPYFIKEVYSDEPTQSSVRYPEAESWRTGFLEPTMRLQYAALKKGAHSIMNVNNIKLGSAEYPIVDWTREAAEKAGFTYERVEHYTMNRRFGNGPDEFAVEPVLVFRKQ